MLQKIEGNFLRWQRSKSGKLCVIQIQTGTIIQSVKISKNLRPTLLDLLTPNTSISVQVKAKKQRMIAKFVVLMPHCDLTIDRSSIPQPIAVKVCTSKHCCKHGSKEICQSLQQLQQDSNIGISISKVGCMGNCKNAPAVRIAGQKHHHLAPDSAVAIVKKIWQKLVPQSSSTATEASSQV
jgi:Thioredoxin-like [2Fe-2S] ferredoxin